MAGIEGSAQGNVDEDSTLLADAAAHLHESIASLDRFSVLLPADEEFHFLSNFPEFRGPIHGVQARVDALLTRISSLSVLSRTAPWPFGDEEQEGDPQDWLVNTQDDILERLDSAFDAFKHQRAKQGVQQDDDGFMFQNSRKKRRKDAVGAAVRPEKRKSAVDGGASAMAQKDGTRTERCPIPFHVWSIPRPQDKFVVPVDNSNTPFKHPPHEGKAAGPLNQDSEVGITTAHHPLKGRLDNLDISSLAAVLTVEPKNADDMLITPFTFVNTHAALRDLATKLSQEREFAVDLEHHQFRTFQGLTCLMQISTRSEDFIIDTLELRSFIGPQLQDVFADASIQKVMHGADWDVLWLQRDFGIYICNLFDTGQASRVLELKSFGLSHLLETFCGVVPDKRYQMADWRLRPLPNEMMKYAREDTHYLLYVGDILKGMLLSTQCGDLKGQEPLKEVFKRSREISLKLYEKEMTTDKSYLQVFGLQEKQFQAGQLAVLSGLYAWRDKVARAEDESTGYVLPNHLLLRLAEEMPDTVQKLRTMLKSKHSMVARNIATVVDIINKSRSMASMFQNEITLAKKGSMPITFEQIPFGEGASKAEEAHEDGGLLSSEGITAISGAADLEIKDAIADVLPGAEKALTEATKFSSDSLSPYEISVVASTSEEGVMVPRKEAVLKKQEVKGLASLFGRRIVTTAASSSAKLCEDREQVEARLKAEKIRASLTLPFHSFEGVDQPRQKPWIDEVTIQPMASEEQALKDEKEDEEPEEMIMLETSSHWTDTTCKEDAGDLLAFPRKGISTSEDGSQCRLWWPDVLCFSHQLVPDKGDRGEAGNGGVDLPLCISEKYRPSQREIKDTRDNLLGNPCADKIDCMTAEVSLAESSIKSKFGVGDAPFEPFDYAAAKLQMGFYKGLCNTDDGPADSRESRHSRLSKSSSLDKEVDEKVFDPHRRLKDFKPDGISPGKRRQVFPQSGNRTGVFK